MGHLQALGQSLADARVAAFSLDGSAFTAAATAARQHYRNAETTRLKQALKPDDFSRCPIPSLVGATNDEVDRLQRKWERVASDSDCAAAMLAAVKKWREDLKKKPGQGKNGLAVRDDSSSSSSSFFFSTYEYRD